MVVVLPAPLSPRRAKMDPRGTSRLSRATAFFVPKCLDSSRISIAGSMRRFLPRCRLDILLRTAFFGAIRFAVGPGEFFVDELADLFGRQGAGSGLTERRADP